MRSAWFVGARGLCLALAVRPTAALLSPPLRARAALTATVDAHGRRRV
jgi:hypothetical protein